MGKYNLLAVGWNVKVPQFLGTKDLRVELLDFACYRSAVDQLPDDTGWKRHREELGADVSSHARHLYFFQIFARRAKIRKK